jgi:hypothetical protein
MTERLSTTKRAPCARPAPTFSTVEAVHTGLIERLAVGLEAASHPLHRRCPRPQGMRRTSPTGPWGSARLCRCHRGRHGPRRPRRVNRPEISPRLDLRCGWRRCGRERPRGGEGPVNAAHGRRQCVAYLPGFLWVRLRSLTPGPPPFSSVNSTPAASNARRTAKSLAAVIDVSSAVSSARRIVVTPTDDAFARSAALQRMRARAARIWALVRGEEDMLTYHFSMYRLYHMEYSIRGRDEPK